MWSALVMPALLVALALTFTRSAWVGACAGIDLVNEVYSEYRDPQAVEAFVQHLHNNPLHIAAERGLPALAVWVWFLVVATTGLVTRMRERETCPLAAAGLAAITAMIAAGMFEYDFGDSEFLMLLLVMITLPHAAGTRIHSVHQGRPTPAPSRPRRELPILLWAECEPRNRNAGLLV